MTRSLPRRLLAWLTLLPLTLYVLYLLVANSLLASDWARDQLERERLQLGWERAWTLYPGHLRVTELTLSGAAAQRRYVLQAESATLGFELLPLLQRRIRISDLDAVGIRQAELDGYRLEGQGTLRLRNLQWHASELAVGQLALTLSDGQLRHGATLLVEDVALHSELRLDPLRLAEHPGRAAAQFVSGTLELAGYSDAYDVFNPYLTALDWLQIGGHGELQGELAIKQGEVQPGSYLRLNSPKLNALLDERHWLENGAHYQVHGSGMVAVNVAEQARLTLTLNDIEIFDLSAEFPATPPRPLAHAEEFRLELATNAMPLHAPPDTLLDAGLHLDHAEVADIAVFNHYLPEPVPLTLHNGSANLNGGLRYATGRLSGAFDLNGEAISLRLGNEPLRGRLDLTLPIVEFDVERGLIDISGTDFAIEAVTYGESQPLTTRLELPTARFHSPLAWRELDDDALFNGETPWRADLELHGHVANLGVLDPFLADLFNGNGLALTGGGRITGALRLHQDELQAGSRLDVQSEALGAQLFGFRARGDGRLQLAVPPDTPAPETRLALEFAAVEVTRLADLRQLLQAEQLALTATLPTRLLADIAPQWQLVWRNARIPDVSVLNTYLPAPTPLHLLGGMARSDGEFTLADERGQGQLTLRGSAINGHLLNETFHGELDATLVLREYQHTEPSLDLSGSRLEVTASTAQDAPLHTLLVARQARLEGFDWPDDEIIGDAAAPRSLNGTLQLDGLVDRLSFLNAFLPEEHGLAIQGGGRLSADLRLINDTVTPGSQLHIHSEQLGARFLHYEAFGDGSLALQVTDPGAELRLSLPRFGLRRQESSQALIEGYLLSIRSQAQHFSLPEGLRSLNTDIDMPHLVVPDLAVLNTYLPPDSGIQLLSGEARIATRLRLEGMRAHGNLLLQAPQTRLAFNEQTLEGELELQAQLQDGDLETLDFDASGSQLTLRNVHLQDSHGGLSHGWWARLALPEGRVRWATPLDLDARLELAMRDSGLLVDLFLDAVRERRWLRNRLTLGEVRGETRILLDDDTIRLENLALHGGEHLELLANLALRDAHPLGRAFVRYGPLRLGIELDGEQRRWQLRNARDWYATGQPASELTLPTQYSLGQWEWFEQLDVSFD